MSKRHSRTARNSYNKGWSDGVQTFIEANNHLWGGLLVEIPEPPVTKEEVSGDAHGI